jgi:hypothetical protein
MQKITATAELKNSILLLELKQAEEVFLLKAEIINTYEHFRPINLIKSALNKFMEAPDFKTRLLNTTLSLATGYVAKKLTIGTTHNPIKQLLGVAVQMGVTSLLAKNSTGIKSTMVNLFTTLFNKEHK